MKMDTPKTKRIRRPWLWILLGLFIITFIGLTINKFYLHYQIKKRLDVIRAQGHPTTLEEVDAGYEIPVPGQNAADIYMKAFDQLVHWQWKPIPEGELEKIYSTMDDTSRIEPNIIPDPSIKRLGFDNGRRPYFEEEEIEIPKDWDQKNGALLPVIGYGYFPDRGKNMTAKALEIVEEYLQDQGKSLQLLRQACAFEKSRYPLITRDDYLSSPFLGAFRQCQFILQIEAYYYAQNQKPEESLQSVNAMIALNRSLKSEPSAISQLIKMAFENEVVRTLEYMFNIFALTEQQLNSIRVALEKCHQENNVTDTLISERALCHDHLQEVFQWPQSDKWKYLKLFYSWLGYSERQRILYLDQMEHYIKISEYPFPRRFLAIKDVHLKSMLSQEEYDFLEAVKWGNVELFQKESKNIAFYRLAQIALALERYRLAHNQLPISLSDLIPDYLEGIPKDPYDGQNIRYMKIENGYKIYSVGDDCIDNKGKGELFPVLLTELEPGYDYVFTVQR